MSYIPLNFLFFIYHLHK